MNEYERVRSQAPLEDYVHERLGFAKGRPICPFCGSGGHDRPGSDSGFHVMPDKMRFKCFSCGRKGDVFDLCAQVEGIPEGDKRAQLEEVKRWASISGDVSISPREKKPRALKGVEGPKLNRDGALRYLRMAQARLPECLPYLESRGFDLETARRFGFGFDPRRRMLLLPYPGNEYYYVGRLVDPNAKIRHLKPKSSKVGPEPIFNPSALSGDYLFVVEGQIDAFSLLGLGFEAVAIGGAANWQKLLRELRESPSAPKVFVLFDKDEPGQRAADSFSRALCAEGVENEALTPEGVKGKDPNDWLVEDKDELAEFLDLTLARNGLGGRDE